MNLSKLVYPISVYYGIGDKLFKKYFRKISYEDFTIFAYREYDKKIMKLESSLSV